MGYQVRNLVLKLQTGSDNTYFATWEAPVSTSSTTTVNSSGTVKAGSLVSIKSGATYYNGVAIPPWVTDQKWYVHSVNGDRAVINKNESGTNSIMSPINVKYLSGSSSSGSGSGSGSSSSQAISNIDHYEVVWKYATGDNVAFVGSETTVSTSYLQSTYSPPENATKVAVHVKPIAKKREVNGKETPYWTGSWVSVTLPIANVRPVKPSTPDVEIDKYKLTATVDNISDERTDQIEFWVYKNDAKFTSGIVTVLLKRAVFTCDVDADSEYRVCCRAINTTGGTSYSEWSDYAGPFKTFPSTVTNVKCEAYSKTSVKLTWDEIVSADSYTVEYTTKKEYFDTSSSVSTASTETNTAIITGMDPGYTYYFRVRASNEDGDSGWSDIVSAVVGTKPEPPTTWSLTTTAYVGEEVILYWTHNAEDGSKQQLAYVYVSVGDVSETYEVESSVPEDEDEPVYSYKIDTSKYSDGGVILWKVSTKGVADDFSDWSTLREIHLFAPPTVQLATNISNGVVTSLPITLTATPGPNNQTPLSYHISVTAIDSYETVDNVGNNVFVSAGSDIYAKTVISSDRPFTHTISAGDITLESGQNYKLNVLAAMDSGLTGTATANFEVSWVVKDYICDASVTIDKDTLSAYIAPFCVGENDTLIQDVTLAVYRREADGSFTEIGSGLSNTMVTTVTDPHPSLDYARYRIVATDTTTGAVEYSDLPGQEIGEPAIVIQWEEEWSSFDYDEEFPADTPPWTGSMVRLPYNVDVSEKSNPDVALIEYIGRKNPVSYYGTQRGETGTWATEIDKKDVETIYALRRLKAWNGDVYVREPSGIGYWANINVSMSRRHRELTIPVGFEITRVEGGM